jgi:hypothetical protein
MPGQKPPKKPRKTAAGRKAGQQTLYTEALANEILDRLIAGESLHAIIMSDPERFPAYTTILLWASDDREGFRARFEAAKSHGYDRRAENLLKIARGDQGAGSTGDVKRDRLIWDAERWDLSKRDSKRFGDKLQVDSEVIHKFETLDDDALNARIATILGMMSSAAKG